MPSRRRSRSVFENDEDESTPAPESPKRQRRLQDTPHEDKEEEDDGGDYDPFAPTQRTNQLLQRLGSGRANEYSPGAVVRVKLFNFVTYENAVFYPGPNLNMIIGPNGTGKSSLVCALALGLGYSPSVLDRASKVNEYVTHGRDSAIVEIELQNRHRDRPNHVIRLEITRENNRQRWWLNGKETNHKSIQKLVASLRIACDNLCQFLPQEKVAQFAGLTPVQLLHETLRAAAPEEMIRWQSELKDLFKDFKNVKSRVDNDSEHLQNLETRQQGLQADVDRLNERDAITTHVADLKTARYCAEYDIARAKKKECGRQKKAAERRLKELEGACGPALKAVHRKEAYRSKIKAVVAQHKTALREAETTTAQAFRAVEVVNEKINDSLTEIDGEKKSFQAKRSELGKARQTLTKLEAQHRTVPPSFNAPDWNQKIREKEHMLRDITSDKRELGQTVSELKSQGRSVQSDLHRIQQNIEQLDSQQGQNISFLKKLSPEAYRGWEWLQDNLGKFEKEVFGPPMLTCSLRDERYSDLVQSMLMPSDFLSFTCQTRNDHKILSDKFYKEMGLSVTIRTCATDFRSFRSPVSADEIRQFGLDGFAVDYLEGPEPVLAMLCSERHLHTSGVALKEVSPQQFDALQKNQRINTWATGKTYFRVIRRREYGPDATTTSTRKVNPGRFWTDQPVDAAEKADLRRQLNEKMGEKEELSGQIHETRTRIEERSGEEKDIESDLETLRREKNELQAAYSQWSSLPDKIDAQKATVTSKQKSLQDCRTRISELDARLDELLIKKNQAVLEHKDKVSQIRAAHAGLVDVQIRLIEAASDVRGLDERNGEITKDLKEKREEIERLADLSQAAREEAVAASDKIIESAGEDNARLKHLQEMVEGKTIEDIDHEISAEEAKLELIHVVNPSVLAQFEKRTKDIEEMTKKLEDANTKLSRLADQIKELMEKFEPKLDDIIAQINQAFGHNFDMISCAGEVSLHKDEDFGQWAIEIKVKFRENEELQLLNQHRQSGGERAVSTVFYIMALQSMAQAPFRVVDEINQGMDPRNERMVHERMVEIACREHTSQYFLITPKLLTGLRYDEQMRVLCIASGVNVPEEAVELNFDSLVKKQLAMKAAA